MDLVKSSPGSLPCVAAVCRARLVLCLSRDFVTLKTEKAKKRSL